MNKRILIVIICLLISFSSSGCCKINNFKEQTITLNQNYNELFTDKEFIDKCHKSVNTKYLSTTSIGYNNTDGTTSVYVYSAPIFYETENNTLSMIDTRIANATDENMRNLGYIYTIANNNIQPYYPKLLNITQGILLTDNVFSYEFGINTKNNIYPEYIKHENFIGEIKPMLFYPNINSNTNILLYPSFLGSNCEIQFENTPDSNTLEFWIRVSENAIVEKSSGGYITISENQTDSYGKTTKNILGIIQAPLLRNSNGDISYLNTIDYEKGPDKTYKLFLTFDKQYLTNKSTAFLSFEIRKEKQPDNCLYSNKPNLEYAYLNNYSIIGNSQDYGLGRLMIRFACSKIFNFTSNNIKNVNYYLYNISNHTIYPELEMVSVLDKWCALTGNWSNNYQTGERVFLLNSSQPELKFDITNEFKKWCDDPDIFGQMELKGLQLKSVKEEENTYDIILSNDNSLYRNYTEIILK